MSKLGGNTPLGKQINRLTTKTDHMDVGRFKTARAVIKKAYKDSYIFYMDLIDGNGNVIGKTGPVPVIGTEDQLAMFYGSPANMTGGTSERWEAIIFYQGTNASAGIAMVSRRLHEMAGGRYEAVVLSNELVAQGAAYAPPGSGMM